ncbi:MAG: sialidase family protein [Niabella sp.]
MFASALHPFHYRFTQLVACRVIKVRNRILFVNPDSRNNLAMLNVRNNFRRRENLTAKLSYTEGKTWDIVKVLDAGEAGYSDLATDREGNIYCLHEATVPSKEFWTQRIVLRKFNLEWLTNGRDAYEKAQ